MRLPKYRWSFGLSSVGVILSLVVATSLALPRIEQWISPKRTLPQGLATALVQRSEMDVTLLTGGKVDSSEKTIIECELERLELSVKGQAMVGGGTSTILQVVADGTAVKKGDLLCELDSSEYVEMLRQQKMTVKRSQADHRQAELSLDVAKMAVLEFEEGTMKEALKELAGLVALGESTWERARDRLLWSGRMLDKGYIAVSQLRNEEINERKAAFTLRQNRVGLDVFQRYNAPRVLRELQGQVLGAEALLNYQDQRLQRHIEREEMLRTQIERCTIVAPHDGLVIYAYNDDRPVPIEEGMIVRQKQDLFYLPNMSRMVAKAFVHESVASRVQAGMSARVRIEGLPGREITGHVSSIAQLPTQNYLNEVRYFYTEIELDSTPSGLKPGMTAEVEIATEHRENVLTIPIGALAIDDGQDFCYIAHQDEVERRHIEIGQSTRGLLEVTEGLDEGERVVLDPTQFDHDLDTLSPFDPEFDSLAAEVH